MERTLDIDTVVWELLIAKRKCNLIPWLIPLKPYDNRFEQLYRKIFENPGLYGILWIFCYLSMMWVLKCDAFVGVPTYAKKGETLLGGALIISPKLEQYLGLGFPNRYVIGLDAW